jgi:hypothetical protein
MRALLISLLAIALAACGSGELSLTDYAAEVESMVAEMESRFATIDAEWESEPPTVERASDYWDDRLEIRNDFLEFVEALNPPEEIVEMHRAAIEVFTRITDADVALSVRAAEYETLESHWQWADTPEGQAADAVLADVFAFCRDSQDEFDATREREELEELAWIPAEMKEVVRVAFGCPPADE